MAADNPEGRPLKFKSVEELQYKIDLYFQHCKEDKKPPTITGLALALDTSRQTLVNYEKKSDEYFDTIKKAKLVCELFLEESLFGNNVTGVIFNLKNNYGWRDKTEVDANNTNTNMNTDVNLLDPQQRRALIESYINRQSPAD